MAWTEEKRKDACAAYLNGDTVDVIAARYGKTRNSVVSLMRREFPKQESKSTLWEDEESAICIRLWDKGLSTVQISARLPKRTAHACRSFIERHPHLVTRKGEPHWSDEERAEKFGMSIQAVRRKRAELAAALQEGA